MTSVTSEPLYVSVGCNRLAGAADQWLGATGTGHGLVAFGADRSVALYNPESDKEEGVIATLPGHAERVNCVRFLNATTIVSGATDGSIRVWGRTGGSSGGIPTEGFTTSLETWRTIASWKDHQGPVVAIACLPSLSGEGGGTIVTAGSDGGVRSYSASIYEDTAQIESTGIITLGPRPALALALTRLIAQSDVPLLAVSGTDSHIFLYVPESHSAEKWRLAVKLGGHTDWVRALDFLTVREEGEDVLFLASASQDKYVRIWRIAIPAAVAPAAATEVSAPPSEAEGFEEALAALSSGLGDTVQLSTRSYLMQHGTQQYSVQLDALLLGHEDWVHSVRWAVSPEGQAHLVTASADKSVQLWHKTGAEEGGDGDGVWENFVRVGEAAGPGSGFFGAFLSGDARSLLAYSYHGAIHRWRREGEGTLWVPSVAPGGHFRAVQRLVWEPKGRYVLSVSLDQTARLHGPWVTREGDGERREAAPWYEMGRPQVHGYDMRCAVFVGDGYGYASGSDEKVIRVFHAPRLFYKTLLGMAGGVEGGEEDAKNFPLAANLPALGLSNKAILPGSGPAEAEEGGERDAAQEVEESYSGYVPHISQTEYAGRPPIETELRQQTFWPETQKLYGHGYEVTCVDASQDGTCIASACRASKAEHAGIRLYRSVEGAEGAQWKEATASPASPIMAHQLTITRLAFSPDARSQYLLSVSRDRSWSLSRRVEEGEGEGVPYVLEASMPKAHARIIWDAAWGGEGDGAFFATASRDKMVKVWACEGEGEGKGVWRAVSTLKFPDACTSIALTQMGDRHIMAVGLESGEIHIISRVSGGEEWITDRVLQGGNAHTRTVLSLAFRPTVVGDAGDSSVVLASSGADHQVRLTRVVYP